MLFAEFFIHMLITNAQMQPTMKLFSGGNVVFIIDGLRYKLVLISFHNHPCDPSYVLTLSMFTRRKFVLPIGNFFPIPKAKFLELTLK